MKIKWTGDSNAARCGDKLLSLGDIIEINSKEAESFMATGLFEKVSEPKKSQPKKKSDETSEG